jgi:hypothetical protein
MSADQSVQWLDETRLSDLEKSPPRLRLGHEGAPQPNVRVESFEEDDEDEYECCADVLRRLSLQPLDQGQRPDKMRALT